MTGVNGNGNAPKSAKARAREVVAARLAEAKRRLDLDRADIEVLIGNGIELAEDAKRRDQLVAEAHEACAQRAERINADSAAVIARWVARGGTEASIADATGLTVSAVRKLRQRGPAAETQSRAEANLAKNPKLLAELREAAADPSGDVPFVTGGA